MRGILNIFTLFRECLTLLSKILKGEFRAIPIDSSNIDYLYHVVDKEHVQNIIDDGYILLQRNSSDFFAMSGNEMKEDTRFLYDFK